VRHCNTLGPGKQHPLRIYDDKFRTDRATDGAAVVKNSALIIRSGALGKVSVALKSDDSIARD